MCKLMVEKQISLDIPESHSACQGLKNKEGLGRGGGGGEGGNWLQFPVMEKKMNLKLIETSRY